MVLFNKCCFCFSLENGTIAIAVLEIIAVISRFIVGITNTMHFHGVSSSLQVTLNVIVSVILIAVAALLIYAVVKRIARYFFPWLGITLISIIFNIIFVLLSFVASDVVTYSSDYRIVLIISTLFDIYFLLVVYSLYKILGGDIIRVQRPHQTI